MKNTTTIVADITNYLKNNGLILSDLARETEMNPGTMSGIIHGNRTVSVDQLDRITEAMGLSEGYYYDQYIDECLSDINPNWRRIRPFIYRCSELDRLDYIQRVVNLLLDKLAYSLVLFELAEDFFEKGVYATAAVLYENVAISQRKQHSETLAICQYRLFKIGLGQDRNQNLHVAIRFEPFIERLDEMDQLDAIKDLANTYRSLHMWDKVKELAVLLEQKADIQYNLNDKYRKRPSRPLFTYLAYSKLLQAGVCDARGDYEQALNFTYAYADLSWVKETDEETQHWVSQFSDWAQANIYVNKLLSGQVDVLMNYVEYIAPKKDEILFALYNIMVAANRYNMNVDHIIHRFEEEIKGLLQQKPMQTYVVQTVSDHLVGLLHELSVYYLNNQTFPDGFKWLLDSLGFSAAALDRSGIIKAVGLFESYRKSAPAEIKAAYQNLIKEVYKGEKEHDHVNSSL
ncbi:helix-turn-helix domain-containing protein [Paenibacillus polymyxa]|uniref:helix-turn-helix domain-containing protein n=1 Tax=Paenibacillus polymyxa TaxID=1406 RepID=UPI0025B702C3|nr:helix-turn-helix transcriptional regulator [Paenibacillus polymyxa]MDN4090972.1 helix-turn-helix transcriptional regulator [Paenibacillus polymyxa]